MPSTYIFIAKTTLTSTASIVTFSSIPSTYTDLVVKSETRITTSTGGTAYAFWPNNNTSGTFYFASCFGDAATGGRANSGADTLYLFNTASNLTNNAFSINEAYYTNYANTSLKKVANAKTGTSDNSLDANYIGWVGSTWDSTSAISSLTINNSVYVWDTGSSFTLYGIKNS